VLRQQFPVCPIAAKYDAATALPKIETKGGKILANAVVYRIETGEKNSVEAVHYFDPDKRSHRVTAKIFVIACNGIETPKLLLLSNDERNPNGAANSSDQVGRNMMDQPKLTAELELKEPLWTGVGPVQSSSISQYHARRLPQPVCRRDVPYGKFRPQSPRCSRRAEKRAGRKGPG
jgi:fructose 5-dehydrogenase large subunit